MPGFVIRVYATVAVAEDVLIEDADDEQEARGRAEREVEDKLSNTGDVSIMDSAVEEVIP